jgi:hypothetical protein
MSETDAQRQQQVQLLCALIASVTNDDRHSEASKEHLDKYLDTLLDDATVKEETDEYKEDIWFTIPGTKLSVSKAWGYRIPYFNIFFDAIFDEVPDREKLSEMLNILGQMAAFMLTVALATPLTVSYDDLLDVKARFDNPPYNYTLGYEEMVVRAIESCAVAMYLQAAAVIMICLMFAFTNTGLENASEAKNFRHAWWGVLKWIVLAIMLFVLVGVVATFYSWNYFVQMRWPDLYLEDLQSKYLEAESNGDFEAMAKHTEGMKKLPFPSWDKSVGATLRTFGWFFLMPLMLFALTFISLAKWRASSAYQNKLKKSADKAAASASKS